MKRLFVTLLFLSLCAVAQAGTIPFSASINESGVTFTQIDAIASSGSTLTAMNGGTLLTPAYETWSFSPGITNFTFTLAGQQPDTLNLPATVALFALDGNIVVDSALATFVNGGMTDIVPLDGARYQDMRDSALAGQVPEPATFVFIGSGLVGLVLTRRKRK